MEPACKNPHTEDVASAPAAPIEPIAPAEPIEPIAPAEPIEPIAPAEPIEPAMPASMKTLIWHLRSLYRNKPSFTQVEKLKQKRAFINVYEMRESLGFPENVSINCESAIQKIFLKGFGVHTTTEQGIAHDRNGVDFDETNYPGLGEFLAIVLRVPIPAEAAENTDLDFEVNIDAAFIENLSTDDAMHVWYCLLTWPFVFNEHPTDAIENNYLIGDHRQFMAIPFPLFKDDVAKYLASKRCIDWTAGIFASFTAISPTNAENVVRADHRGLLNMARVSLTDNPPFPNLATFDRLFRFFVVWCLEDLSICEGADEGFMEYIACTTRDLASSIEKGSYEDDRDPHVKFVLARWNRVRLAFPCLPETPPKCDEAKEEDGDGSSEEEDN